MMKKRRKREKIDLPALDQEAKRVANVEAAEDELEAYRDKGNRTFER